MKNINEPTLLLKEQVCKTNIRQMAAKARKQGLVFKPHMKTHQSAEIGQWMRDTGVKSITVSSVKMATYFAKHGWEDITIAFPCNILKVDEIDNLAKRVNLTLLINQLDTVKALRNNLTTRVNTYIEIDTGSNRTGLQLHQQSDIEELIDELEKSRLIKWNGFYSHPGHSYSACSRKEILSIHEDVVAQFRELRTNLSTENNNFEVCIGDTPCCTVGTKFYGINAISPGNFVFYDLMQHKIGCCEIKDIAVAMACPIVDKYPERNELVIHGGAIHFSKETLKENGISHFGKPVVEKENHWEIENNNSYLVALSQEHGIIKCSDQLINNYQIGDAIKIIPVHSCLTANLMKTYKIEDQRFIHQL